VGEDSLISTAADKQKKSSYDETLRFAFHAECGNSSFVRYGDRCG
jgi:hypothetical protein